MNAPPLKTPFFFDGAFGTYYSLLAKKAALCEYANESDPDIVLGIHRAYL